MGSFVNGWASESKLAQMTQLLIVFSGSVGVSHFHGPSQRAKNISKLPGVGSQSWIIRLVYEAFILKSVKNKLRKT